MSNKKQKPRRKCIHKAIRQQAQANKAKAAIFALVPLTPKERDTINTMIDFFRSSGEEDYLEPAVYEAIADKLGNGRQPGSLAAVDFPLRKLIASLRTHAAETTGVEANGSPSPGTAAHHLHGLALQALSALKEVEGVGTPHVTSCLGLSERQERLLVEGCNAVLGALADVLGADGYVTTSFDCCDCDDFRGDKGVCCHTRAIAAQEKLRSALWAAGVVRDNFDVWSMPS